MDVALRTDQANGLHEEGDVFQRQSLDVLLQMIFDDGVEVGCEMLLLVEG